MFNKETQCIGSRSRPQIEFDRSSIRSRNKSIFEKKAVIGRFILVSIHFGTAACGCVNVSSPVMFSLFRWSTIYFQDQMYCIHISIHFKNDLQTSQREPFLYGSLGLNVHVTLVVRRGFLLWLLMMKRLRTEFEGSSQEGMPSWASEPQHLKPNRLSAGAFDDRKWREERKCCERQTHIERMSPDQAWHKENGSGVFPSSHSR